MISKGSGDGKNADCDERKTQPKSNPGHTYRESKNKLDGEFLFYFMFFNFVLLSYSSEIKIQYYITKNKKLKKIDTECS